MKAPTITVTLPAGEVIKRATHREYSHVVVISHPQHAPQALAWCSRPWLAEGQLRYWMKREAGSRVPRLGWKIPWAAEGGWQLQILPVDGTDGKPVGPVILAPVTVGEDENPLNLPI